MTPGNHDLAAPVDGPNQEAYKTAATRGHLPYWAEQGVDLTNRVLDIDGCQLILLDSALSDLTDGADAWLDRELKHFSTNLLFTHVPIDLPESSPTDP